MAFERSVYAPRPYVRSGRVADLIQQGGRDEAAAHLRSGEITARLFGNLGDIASGAVNQYQQEKIDAPIRAQRAKLVDLRTSNEQLTLDRNTQADEDADALAEAQRIFQDPERVEQWLVQNGKGHLVNTFRETTGKLEETRLRRQQLQGELDASDADELGWLAIQVRADDYSPESLEHALANLDERFDPAGTRERLAGSTSEEVRSYLEGLILKSEAASEWVQNERDYELRQEAEARQTREGAARIADTIADNARAQVAQTETRRHNLAMEATDPIADQTARARLAILNAQLAAVDAGPEDEKMNAAAPVLAEMRALADEIFKSDWWSANFVGAWDTAMGAANKNEAVKEYRALVRGFSPMIARAIGHTGVLTDVDLDRTEDLFASIGLLGTDSRAIAKAKFDRVERLMQGTASQAEKSALRDEWFPEDGQADDMDALFDEYSRQY